MKVFKLIEDVEIKIQPWTYELKEGEVYRVKTTFFDEEEQQEMVVIDTSFIGDPVRAYLVVSCECGNILEK